MQNAPPRQPWRTSFTLPAPPSCPLCGEPLHPTDWSVRLGAAWCVRCQWTPEDELAVYRGYLARGETPSLCRVAHGVTFYIPFGTHYHGLPAWYPANCTTVPEIKHALPRNHPLNKNL